MDQDVNTGEAQAEESSAETYNQVDVDTSESSAETLNTDAKIPETIPYQRFKEENQAKKEALEKLKALESKYNDEKYNAYSQFDDLLSQSPELYEAVQDVFSKHFQNQEHAVNQSEPSPQDLRLNQWAYDRYIEEFNALAEKSGFIDDAQKDAVYKLTESELLKINKKPLENFKLGDIRKAFGEAQKKIDSFRKADRAAYIEGKEQDQVPASTTKTGTASMRQGEPLRTRAEKAAYFAEVLKKTS